MVVATEKLIAEVTWGLETNWALLTHLWVSSGPGARVGGRLGVAGHDVVVSV